VKDDLASFLHKINNIYNKRIYGNHTSYHAVQRTADRNCQVSLEFFLIRSFPTKQIADRRLNKEALKACSFRFRRLRCAGSPSRRTCAIDELPREEQVEFLDDALLRQK